VPRNRLTDLADHVFQDFTNNVEFADDMPQAQDFLAQHLDMSNMVSELKGSEKCLIPFSDCRFNYAPL
jgi:hypothetical protein